MHVLMSTVLFHGTAPLPLKRLAGRRSFLSGGWAWCSYVIVSLFLRRVLTTFIKVPVIVVTSVCPYMTVPDLDEIRYDGYTYMEFRVAILTLALEFLTDTL
jgi:hypothetical protein